MTPDGLSEAERDAYEERAGIYEHDAGMTRYEAERRAMTETIAKRTLFKEGK